MRARRAKRGGIAQVNSMRADARDGISPDVYVHFDTPLTLDHELLAMREGGFSCVEVVGYIPGDRNTPMLRAIK